MKTVLLLCLAALATAAPQSPHSQGLQEEQRPLAILEEHHEDSGDGRFKYGYQSENGIAVEVSGEPGEEGQNRVKGMYRFPLPNGTMAEVTYTADEEGFKVQSPLVPPMPEHAKEQIIIAQEQEKQGIVFE
ncbi:cuticle protein AMP4-like [Portunus trituberculatus]|uniref:cuticle protein AMP4-like n=1 Tax=Portunus trituberculatus TaxID=210409 RepID=UPI001E1CB1C3|nr:cuticle protein AMP4-like [Portunus trituberculatus]